MNQTGQAHQFVVQRLLAQLQASKHRLKVADSTGTKLTGEQLLIRTLALRRYLMREVIGQDEENVGIFLPPSAPAVATNLAVTLCGRVAVNLNYTVTSAVLRECSEVAGLKHVLTSRRFVEKVNLDPGCPLVFLEDIKDKISLTDKIWAAVNAKLRSAAGLMRATGMTRKCSSDPVTIIFTSGSTGVPKGVVLSFENIDSNVRGIDARVRLNADDMVLGVLPFFHSFGYSITLWGAMTLPSAAAYHFSPLDARQIGKLAQDFGATVLLATPTFLRTYIRRVEREQFSKLDVVVLGAEKMPLALAEDFEKQFGVRPVEGYGTTELSPLVSVNVPPSRANARDNIGWREGTVGQTIERVEARVVALDDETPLPTGESGLLEIRGPNVMLGYYKRPDLTAQAMHDQWYRTGDVARIDEQGFIEITGRLSRFSKIGGEMVPHIQIEETMAAILGAQEDGSMSVAITSVPDEKKGERLVVLHRPLGIEKRELLAKMSLAGLPNLYLPGEDSFLEVEAIPALGSGKLDLKAIKDLANARFGPKVAG